jgi:phage tail tape-measure protein
MSFILCNIEILPPPWGLGQSGRSRRIRHPVSSPFRSSCMEKGLGGAIGPFIIGGMVLPAAPQDPDPSPGKNADGVGVVAAAIASSLIRALDPAAAAAQAFGVSGLGGLPAAGRPSWLDLPLRTRCRRPAASKRRRVTEAARASIGRRSLSR